ncbi:hypothetical protein [Desulfosarcina sp.]|uniref:hypothetical protein n=1 Tax=Desulfosarcina sp. TaxID=2027861 RepID=UPI00397072C6
MRLKTSVLRAACSRMGWLLVLTAVLGGCTSQALKPPSGPDAQQDLEKWGIRLESIRLTGADHFVDFRFRVLDPQKAGSLLGRQEKAYLLHEPSGSVFNVPVTKVGPLRASGVDPKAGRTYVILFSNTSKIIQPDDPVTVVIGDFQATGLRIGMSWERAVDLSPEQEDKWEAVQRDLLRTYKECTSTCAHDRTCQKQCRDAYESDLGNAYVEMLSR